MIFGESETEDGRVVGSGVADVDAVAWASILQPMTGERRSHRAESVYSGEKELADVHFQATWRRKKGKSEAQKGGLISAAGTDRLKRYDARLPRSANSEPLSRM